MKRALTKCVEVLLLGCAIALLMGADNPNARFQRLGRKIMCTCGDCAYMLLECNHVGCPNSTRMIAQLHALTGSGTGTTASANAANLQIQDASANAANLQIQDKDEAVLDWFRKNWGVTAVVEPATHGLELWAWILPPAALGLGILLVIMFVRKWHARHAQQPVSALDPHLDALRARARRETEI